MSLEKIEAPDRAAAAAPTSGLREQTRALVARADRVESEARALLEAVDDALKLRGNRLKAASRRVLDERCDNLVEALNVPPVAINLREDRDHA